MKVKVRKFVDDPKKSWEERFYLLLAHHSEETTWLISAYDELRNSIKVALRKFEQDE